MPIIHEKGRHGIGVIPGAAHIADTQGVSLKLVLAGIALDGGHGDGLADAHQIRGQAGGAQAHRAQ